MLCIYVILYLFSGNGEHRVLSKSSNFTETGRDDWGL